MGDAVGPAVGCLMATFGTNMISSCIFDFDDPDELEEFAVEERIELWGLQVRTCYVLSLAVELAVVSRPLRVASACQLVRVVQVVAAPSLPRQCLGQAGQGVRGVLIDCKASP